MSHVFGNIQFTVGCPEHRVRFDTYEGEPRNADLSLLGEVPDGLVAISVEAKADERFGSSVQGTWNAAKKRLDKGETSYAGDRVRDLLDAVAGKGVIERIGLLELPYQLVTAVAGALALALDSRVLEQERPVRAALLVNHGLVGGKPESGKVATGFRKIERNAAVLEKFIETVFGTGAKPDDCGIYGPFTVPGNKHLPAGVPLYLGKITQQVGAAGPVC